MFSANPFKGVQKRLSKSIQRAGEMMSGIGPSPAKTLRDAILADEEEKALALYTCDKSGKATEEFLEPSRPLKKNNESTLFHLASQMGMKDIIIVFIGHGGNPNYMNNRLETSLHALCNESNLPELRLEILEIFFEWKGVEIDNECEKLSINRVNVDGNAAIHCAAANGLLHCVQRLLQYGAIISLVNKAQQTCCELADAGNFNHLASMLELALVFQPVDESMELFDQEHRFSNENQPSVLVLDCQSLRFEELNDFISSLTRPVAATLASAAGKDPFSPSDVSQMVPRAEALLDSVAWDPKKLDEDLRINPAGALSAARLEQKLVPPPPMDRGPWGSDFGLTKSESKGSLQKSESKGAPLLSRGGLKAGPAMGGPFLVTPQTSATASAVSLPRAGEAKGSSATPPRAAKASASPETDPLNPLVLKAGSNPIVDQAAYPVKKSDPNPATSPNFSTPTEEETSQLVTGIPLAIPLPQDKPVLSNASEPTLPTAMTGISEPTAVAASKETKDAAGDLSIDDILFEGFGDDENTAESGSKLTSESPALTLVVASTNSGVTDVAIPITEPNEAATVKMPSAVRESPAAAATDQKESSQLLTTVFSTSAIPAASTTVAVFAESKSKIQSSVPIDGVGGQSIDNENGEKAEYIAEACLICCEDMLQPVSVQSILSGQVPDVELRAVQCGSGHSFCLGCWSSHLTTRARDFGAHNLPCPGFKCGEVLGAEWAAVMLKDEQAVAVAATSAEPGSSTPGAGGPNPAGGVGRRPLVDRWKDQRVRHVVDCSRQLKWCAHEGCELVVHIKDHRALAKPAGPVSEPIPQTLVCDSGHAYCLSCSSAAHSPCSCSDWASWMEKVKKEMQTADAFLGSDGAKSGDELANAMWVAANTKKCPRCTTPIEKDEGCNHMSCRKCRHEFCWICMQDWSLHSSNTGGFFQCNRFVEAPPAGLDMDLLDMDNSHMLVQAAGSAQMETIRLKNRNASMARFLHHFTRFQAHGQSLAMEARMQKETITRILTGLVDTVHGKLQWLQGEAVPNPLSKDFSIPGLPATGPIGKRLVESATSSDKIGGSQEGGGMGPRVATSSISAGMATPSNTTQGSVASEKASTATSGSSSTSSSSASSAFSYLSNLLSATPGSKSAASLFRSRNSSADGGDKVGSGSASLPGDASAGAKEGGTTAAQQGASQEEALAWRAYGQLECVKFLTAGFEELVRCRQLLQGSFPFAYFAFGDEEEVQTMDPLEMLMVQAGVSPPTGTGLRGTPGRAGAGGGTSAGGSAANNTLSRSQRRHMRMIMADRKLEFEHSQSELEMLTEMLSDVVARRRLRASRSQIIQATKAARSRRVELEQTIRSWLVADAYTREDFTSRRSGGSAGSAYSPFTSAGSSGRVGGITRSTPRSATISGTGSAAGRSGRLLQHHQMQMQQQRMLSGRSQPREEMQFMQNLMETGVDVFDEDDDLELFIQQIERGHNPLLAGTPFSSPSVGSATPLDLRPQQPFSSAPRESASLASTPAGTGTSPASFGTVAGPAAATSASTGTHTPHSGRMVYTVKSSHGGAADDDEDDDDDDDFEAVIRTPTDPRRIIIPATLDSGDARSEVAPAVAAGTTGAAGTGSSNRSRRLDPTYLRQAEEMADLNRAILMSLQDSPPDDRVISAPDSAGAPTVEAAAARANRVPPSGDNIELLISMGFDRESVVSALTSANNNADRATDLLLNAVN